MFDLEWSKLLVIGVVALLVIEPKNLPKVLRQVGYWVRHARQVAAEFQSSIEQMAREAELADVKKDIEDATRTVTADINKSLDPVDVEKLFNPPSPGSETPSIASPATEAAAAEHAASAAPVTDEPTLPFPEPTPPAAAAHAPPTEPAAAQPEPHDRV
jgi:sec-independent protein translocase protein TatB